MWCVDPEIYLGISQIRVYKSQAEVKLMISINFVLHYNKIVFFLDISPFYTYQHWEIFPLFKDDFPMRLLTIIIRVRRPPPQIENAFLLMFLVLKR